MRAANGAVTSRGFTFHRALLTSPSFTLRRQAAPPANDRRTTGLLCWWPMQRTQRIRSGEGPDTAVHRARRKSQDPLRGFRISPDHRGGGGARNTGIQRPTKPPAEARNARAGHDDHWARPAGVVRRDQGIAEVKISSLRTNKPDAARRQIDAAVRIFFDEEDELAVLTLAGAAFRIVRDLSEARGTGFVWTTWKGMIKPGMEAELWGAFNKVPNFLKHANRDPDGVLDDVEDGLCVPMLIFAIWLYADLGFQRTPEMVTFIVWCIAFEQSKGLTAEGLSTEQRAVFENVAKMGRGIGRAERFEVGRIALRGDLGGASSSRPRRETRRML